MGKQRRELPVDHDLGPLTGQRAPWELPWEREQSQEESWMEFDPDEELDSFEMR